MRKLCVAAVALAGVVLTASPAEAQLPPACKASYVAVTTITDKGIAVPDELKADLASGTVRLEVRDFLTGKTVPGGEARDLAFDWKYLAGQWNVTSASSVLALLSKTPNAMLSWSGSTQPTCHQDVVKLVPTKTSK
jgi:hypothetical protein